MSIEEITDAKVILKFTSDNLFRYRYDNYDKYELYYLEEGNWVKPDIVGSGGYTYDSIEISPLTKEWEVNIYWAERYGRLKQGHYILKSEDYYINNDKLKYNIEFEVK